MSTDDERTRIGITRGDQPVEDVARAGMAEGEQAREDELAADRERIGTTRGAQPVESLRDGTVESLRDGTFESLRDGTVESLRDGTVESLRDGDPSVVEHEARDEERELGTTRGDQPVQ